MQVVVVVVASVTVNVVVTAAPVVEPLAGAEIDTTGAMLSTVKLTEALPEPAALLAVTVTVWRPWPSDGNEAGEVQAFAAPPSSEQVMLVGEFVAVKLTEAVVLFVNEPDAGDVIVTTGIAATVNVVVAEPVLPAWSVAATVMLWLPVERPL